MSTRLELRQLFRDIALAYPADAPDELIDRFLLEGYRKVIHRQRWSWLVERTLMYGGLTNPIDTATLSDGFIDVLDLALVDPGDNGEIGTPLQRADRNMLTTFKKTEPAGKPRFYYLQGTRDLYLFPDPEPGTTLDFRFYRDLGWAVGDTEVPGEIPEWAHESTILNFALHRFWERQEDFDRSDAYLGRFEIGIGELVFDENVKGEADRPKVYGEKVQVGGPRNHMPWLDGI